VLHVNALFSVISVNIVINHILLKLDSMEYIFVAGSMGLSSTNFTSLFSKAIYTEFGGITQNNGDDSVQHYSRSPIDFGTNCKPICD